MEELLDKHFAVLEIERGVLDSGVEVLSDQHPFARGQAIRLDDVGSAGALERILEFFLGGDGPSFPGGDVGGCHDIFGESLRALDGSCFFVWAEDGYPGFPECICHTGNKRSFGADDDKINV